MACVCDNNLVMSGLLGLSGLVEAYLYVLNVTTVSTKVSLMTLRSLENIVVSGIAVK